jgi:hypothetical protein
MKIYSRCSNSWKAQGSTICSNRSDSSPAHTRDLLGSHCVPSKPHQGLKRLDREDAHSHSSSAEIKESVEFSHFHATGLKIIGKISIIVMITVINIFTCPLNDTMLNSNVERTKSNKQSEGKEEKKTNRKQNTRKQNSIKAKADINKDTKKFTQLQPAHINQI